jgi:two-component system response regulator AlgR
MSAAKPIRVLIVDDEAPARSRMRDLIADCAATLPVEVVGEAANGREALYAACSLNPDVVLLDIRMPEIGGIEVAEHLLKLDAPPAVIFTTAYDSYAIKAFEVNAIDYLLKPIRAERLLAALEKAKSLTALRVDALKSAAGQARSHLSITDRGRIILVPVKDIAYLKAELKYVTVRTPEKEYLIEESLTKLEQEFAERFVRVHRNCLVARAYVEGFQRVNESADEGESAGSGWVVLLRGLEETLPVSRRQHHVIKEFKG